jgi:hypothetical protein
MRVGTWLILLNVLKWILWLLLLWMVLTRIVWISSGWKVVDSWNGIWWNLVAVINVLVISPSWVSLGVLRLLILVLINLLLVLIKVWIIWIDLVIFLRLSSSTDIWIGWLLSSMIESIALSVHLGLILILFFNELLLSFLVKLISILINFFSVRYIFPIFRWLSLIWNPWVLFRSLLVFNIILLLSCCIVFIILLMSLITSFRVITYDLVVIDALELLLVSIWRLSVLIVSVCLRFIFGDLYVWLFVFDSFLNLFRFQLDHRLLWVWTLILKVDIWCCVCILIRLQLQKGTSIGLHLSDHMLFQH